ncbi:hypothetical protein [Rhodoligotrophos ferricapiens]|uniref:hypothetical protein n=1 Tax=Rhodoligotrophos ferricapiens TaxID=3069264 RepID=UPI00315C6C7E
MPGSLALRLCISALLAMPAGLASPAWAEGIDPAYDSFLAQKAYDVPTRQGLGPAGYTISAFRDTRGQAGALMLGSVGAKPPPPDRADPRYNFIPSSDYGQGAGLNLRFGF